MKNIRHKLVIFCLMLLPIFSLSPAMVLADAKSDIQCGVNNAAGTACNATSQPAQNLDSIISTIINLLSIIVGIVAVIMIIVGGLRYVTSAGSSDKVTSAKNTLLYAIIGLVIVALAQVIARFTLHEVTTNSSSSSTHSPATSPSPGGGAKPPGQS